MDIITFTLEVAWSFLVNILQDYFDLFVAICIVAIAIIILIFPLFLTVINIKLIIRNKLVCILIPGVLLGLFITNTIFYYTTVPKDYVSNLCWRSQLHGSCPESVIITGNQLNNILHFNIILVANMDSYFLENHLHPIQESDTGELNDFRKIVFFLVKMIAVLLDIREHPNFAKRWGEGENIRDCFSRIKGGTVHQHPFKRQ
ncbi:hypothetical protein B4U84_28860 [Westiellopsis prolifica IICB1]|nr:hypothetical protein B4U84_28860 [Westiellopsis prolifica IICB1]